MKHSMQSADNGRCLDESGWSGTGWIGKERGMMHEKRDMAKPESRAGIRTALVLLASLLVLSACDNPIAKAVEDIKADVVSSRMVLSRPDTTVIASGATVDCGQISAGTNTEICLTVANTGKSDLVIDVAGIALLPASGTEKDAFSIVTSPAARVAAGASSSITIGFAPASAGSRAATLSIPTNDTRNAIFSFDLKGTGSSVTITTSAVSSIGMNTATCGGNITNDGGEPITERGICWSGSPNPTIADNRNSDGSTGIGAFSVAMTGLSAGSLYYVRPYATNAAGTTYGPQASFMTCPEALNAPIVEPVDYPAGSGKLLVRWDTVKGAISYELYVNDTGNLTSARLLTTTTQNLYEVPDFVNFKTYYFWVKADNASGSGAASPAGSGSPGRRVTGISLDRSSATIAVGSSEQLNATIAPAEATFPKVTWSSTAPSVATVSDSGLVTAIGPGTATITATSTATAENNESKIATCLISVPSEGPVPPDAPVLKTASTGWSGEVVLSWDASPGASSYNIYYSTSSGAGTAGTKDSGINDTSRTLSGLTNWSKYYFVVTAVGPGGESAISNQLACMPERQEIIVVNNGSDSIDFDLFNATAGTVTRPSGHEYILGPTGVAADGAASAAIDPQARNAIYVAYTGTTTSLPGFYKYGYDAANGYTTAAPGEPHQDGVGPEHLVVVTTPSGKKSLYIAFKAQGYIVMYDIDANGNLGEMHTYYNSRGDSARYLCADPSGKFLFASNYDAGNITPYVIDSATGHLTEGAGVSSGSDKHYPYRSVVTPDGKYLLVTNYGIGNVVCFAISTSGALTKLTSIPTSGEGPTGIAIDASGKNVYVCSVETRGSNANVGLGYLNHFTISNGLLSGESDWSNTLYGPSDLALDATGTRLIVLNLASTSKGSEGGALVYQVNADGTIVPKTGASLAVSFVTGIWPSHLVVVKLP